MEKTKTVTINATLMTEAIKAAGYTQGELSRLIGKNNGYICVALNRGTMPENMEKLICAILGKQPGYFIQAEQNAPVPVVETGNLENAIAELRKDLEFFRDATAVGLNNLWNLMQEEKDLLEAAFKKVTDINTTATANNGYVKDLRQEIKRLRIDVDGITKTEQQRAMDYIEQCLVNGDARAEDIMEGADARCISRSALNQAKVAMHIRVYDSGQGASKKVYWTKSLGVPRYD